MATINYIEKHLKTFNVNLHAHNYWEIIYITEGKGKIETENEDVLEYKKGDLICIPPHLRHINNSSSGFKNIHLTIEDWIPHIQAPTLLPASDLTKDIFPLLDLAYRYFHQLATEHALNLALSNAIITMLNHLLNQSDNSFKLTQAIVNEIINCYTNPDFNLEDAYNLVPLSKEYVRKLFIKEHGISPLQYLKQKRIELAKSLLAKKEGTIRINEIAETCGFSDSAYFSRLFKKETGFAPNDFQLKLLKDNKIYSE